MDNLTHKIPVMSAIYACDRVRQQKVRGTFLVHLVSDPCAVGDLCDDAPACVMHLNRSELTAALCLIGCMLRSAVQLQTFPTRMASEPVRSQSLG